jgi:uncharacterized membrane protein
MHEQFVAVTFPSATMTREGVDAIKRLRAEGSIRIYGTAVVTRDSMGKLSVQEVGKRGHAATVASTLIGGLAGLPFGPLAMAIGAVGGALIGHSAEVLHEGDAAKVVHKISRDVDPGKAVVVVEIAEGGLIEFTALMKRMGGTVLASSSTRGTALPRIPQSVA